jgi:hypothetical protein
VRKEESDQPGYSSLRQEFEIKEIDILQEK